MSATELKSRRDTNANLMATTPAEAEFGYDITNKRPIIGDASKAGGHPIATWRDVQGQAFNAVTAGGTADAVTLTFTTQLIPAAYAAHQRFAFIAANTNTTTVTLNVNSLGAKTIKKNVGGSLANLVAGDITSGRPYDVIYDGTQFVLMGGQGLADGSVTKAKLASASVVQAKIDTLTGSAAGSLISEGDKDEFTMNPYCFFPMIHASGGAGTIAVSGHATDAADPDSPRMGMVGLANITNATWDVDWRYVIA